MSDKYLSEKEWKGFCKNPAWKGDALAKAFAALDKAEKTGPADQLKALDELDKQAALLLKANKADKGLASYLGEVDKAGTKLRKEAEKGLAAAQAKEEEEAEEPASDLVDPKKLAAQLALCKRDPERNVQFGFTDAHDKQEAVLALSPKMSGRKLFAKLQAATGVKTGAYGTAWIDGTQLMLQLDKPLGGLVKKVRVPVKACGFKISKVVLWAEDGTVFEQDDEPDTEAPAAPGAPPRPMAPPSDAPATSTATTTPPEPTPDPLKASFDARLALLGPRVLEALKTQPAEATKLRALDAFAREKGLAAQYKTALAGLDSLEKLLGAGAGAGTATTAPTATPTAGGKVDYAKCRLAWEAAKKKVHADLNKLEQIILDEYRDTPAFAEIQLKLRKLDGVLAAFSDNLSDVLDQALNATDPALRQRHHGEAAGVIRKFNEHAANDAFITQLETNPFLPIDLRGTLVGTLGQLSRLIA